MNRGGGMEETRELLEQPEVDGVLYKDYSPYNKQQGAIFSGMAASRVSRIASCSGSQDPTGAPRALPAPSPACRPRPTPIPTATRSSMSMPGRSGAVAGPWGPSSRTVEKLPPSTRVVTASQLVGMLKTQFGKK